MPLFGAAFTAPNKDTTILKAGHHVPASETPFKWNLAGELTVTRLYNLCNGFFFFFFLGGGGGGGG